MDLAKQRTILISATLIAVVLIAGGAWWLMRGKPQPASPVHTSETLPGDLDVRLSKVTFRGIGNGKYLWEVEAENIDLMNNQTTYKIHGVKTAALLHEGKQEITVNAEMMERNIVSGDLTIFGHVMVMGKDITFRTATVTWNDRNQTLTVPQALYAQLGDITVVAEKGATYSLNTGTLRCNGTIKVGVKSSNAQAAGALVEAKTKSFSLLGPIQASISVDDAEEWAEGQNIPKIPDIPHSIRQRYQDYMDSNKRK